MKEAILVIDVQNDYFKDGRFPLSHTEETAQIISKLIQAGRDAGKEIIYIQHITTTNDAPFFAPESNGCEIANCIKPKPSDKIFIKHFPNSFYETGLHAYLSSQGIQKLIVCGMMTHMCVDTTVRAAKDLGYEIDLIGNACTTRDLMYQGKLLPADLVQQVFLASLDGTFASVRDY